MSGDNVLDIMLGQEIIARLSLKSDQLVWNYTSEWQQVGFPVSPHLPLKNNIAPINIQIFLRNMLPEGHAFEELSAYFNVSKNNTFALMRILGRDMTGALIMLPAGTPLPSTANIRVIMESELQQRLDQRDDVNLVIWDDKPRLSLAGVQDKLNVIVSEDGQLGFGEGTLCSTHILKFEKHKLLHLVLNEYLTMQLARKCGLDVADVKILHFGKNPALLVKRFDRKFLSDLEVKRRQIIDGCQALNLPPEYKYERNFGSGRDVAHIREGASFEKIFNFANSCVNPALTKQKILDWALFNILIFNCDAHGKNISFFIGKNGITLTPFYDLVNIKMYENFSQEMAMGIGVDFDCNTINAYQIVEFAETCNLPSGFVATRLEMIALKILNNLQPLIESIKTNAAERKYLDKYLDLVSKRCEYFLGKVSAIKTLKL